MTYKIKNICCIGAGYVGGPTMAVLAYKCPNLNIEVVDVDKNRIEKWNSSNYDDLPIYEPGLSEIIKKCRGKNLHFTNLVEDKISKADMIFISVNTPTKVRGIGAGKASDLKWVEACSRKVAKYAVGHTIVVEKSTLPVRTAAAIKSILVAEENSNKDCSFDILSNPEFLSEGTAINDLLNPDRVLIGGDKTEAIQSLFEIYNNWVQKEKILMTNIWSSELAKLTSNAFLAQRISSINSISAICEATGADINEVAKAIGSDSRIGDKFLKAGPGFGGSCFKKDILNLCYLSEYFGFPEVSDYWEGVVKLNSWQQHRISKLILKDLFGTISNKKISILGFSFKANTNDTRESPSINICKELLEEGAYLKIFDPRVSFNQIEKDLENPKSNNLEINDSEGKWFFEESIESCMFDVDAIIIMTEWEEFKTINWKKISTRLRKPSWVFDTRSIINIEEVESYGINVWRIGSGHNFQNQ